MYFIYHQFSAKRNKRLQETRCVAVTERGCVENFSDKVIAKVMAELEMNQSSNKAMCSSH